MKWCRFGDAHLPLMSSVPQDTRHWSVIASRFTSHDFHSCLLDTFILAEGPRRPECPKLSHFVTIMDNYFFVLQTIFI